MNNHYKDKIESEPKMKLGKNPGDLTPDTKQRDELLCIAMAGLMYNWNYETAPIQELITEAIRAVDAELS